MLIADACGTETAEDARRSRDRSSSGLIPAPCVIGPPATEIFRAEPPRLMLSAIAGSLTTTPFTNR
jgi:hypothetical protein